MDAFLSLPPQSAEIFERLSKGLFISHNNPSGPTQNYFELIQKHEETYTAYFKLIGFQLEKGKGYYYFSKPETKSQIEDKLEKLYRYLDSLEILYMLLPELGVGDSIVIPELTSKLDTDPVLKQKLMKLPLKGGVDAPLERLSLLCKNLEKESFLSMTQENPEQYLVLDAFLYLIQLIKRIDAHR
ncbi:MAG: hypothetical protein AAFY71_08045 [Bacteroidota bacterium]